MNMAAAAPNGPPGADTPRPAPGRPEKLRLGDVLVQQRLISQEQLQQTLDLQRTTGWDPLESTCRHASLSIL